MGVDLKLYPNRRGHYQLDEGVYYHIGGLCCLEFERDYDLQAKIKLLKKHQLPVNVFFSESDGVLITEDKYGDKLHYVLAGDLAYLLKTKIEAGWNLAILRFMQCLHPETPVVLMWS